MKYISCKVCSVAIERRAVWQGVPDIYDHIQKEHPKLVEEIDLANEQYEEKVRLFKEANPEPPTLRDYVFDESFPKKEGRKEYEGRLIDL